MKSWILLMRLWTGDTLVAGPYTELQCVARAEGEYTLMQEQERESKEINKRFALLCMDLEIEITEEKMESIRAKYRTNFRSVF